MTRRVAAVVVALTIFPRSSTHRTLCSPSRLNRLMFTKARHGSSVVGHASKGTELPVMRNLGSWVLVPWTGAPDGIGYVHTSMVGSNLPAATAPAAPAPTPTPTRARTTSAAAPVSASPTATSPRGTADNNAPVGVDSRSAERTGHAHQPHCRRWRHGWIHEQLRCDRALVAR